MTARQENMLSMAKAVQLTLTSFKTLLTAKAFIKAAKDFDNIIATIDGLAQVQSKQFTGTAKDKEQVGDNAIAVAIKLTGPARSYALEEKNNTLYAALDYTPTSLKRLRDTTLSNTLTLIRDTVQAEIDNLADYGLLPADVNQLTALISLYAPLVAAPRAAITFRAAATEALVRAYEELTTTLDKLDGLAEAKQGTDFYATYQSARVVVDMRGGGKEEEVPKV